MFRTATTITLVLLLAGCAHQVVPTGNDLLRPLSPQDQRSNLTLDQIPDKPELVQKAAEPAEPPVDALVLYAQGVDLLGQGKVGAALTALHKAWDGDSHSYAIAYQIGRAEYVRAGKANPASIESLEKAADLRPDYLHVQLLLAREFFQLGEFEQAFKHLRLAVQTSDFAAYPNDTDAALTRLYLGRCLQGLGYDRAAIQQYSALLDLLADPAPAMFADSELAVLAGNPNVLQLEIGLLLEKHGEYARAAELYQAIAESDPADFSMQQHWVRALLQAGASDKAMQLSAEAVLRFDASADSVALLREVCAKLGNGKNAVETLQKLREKQPKDHALMFALADVLVDENHADQAAALLQKASTAEPADGETAEKLAQFYLQREDVAAAARVLLIELSVAPDALDRIAPLWDELTRPTRKNALRISGLQTLQVPPSAQAARLFMLYELASQWQRESLGRQALKQAVAIKPAFDPAYRAMASSVASQDKSSRATAIAQLAAAAKAAGRNDLALEVQAIDAMSGHGETSAVDSLKSIIAAGNHSPAVQMLLAEALRQGHDFSSCQQTLWLVVEKYPRLESAWLLLYQNYQQNGEQPGQLKVIVRWLKADPGNRQARMLQWLWVDLQGTSREAEPLLQALLNDFPDDADILEVVDSQLVHSGRQAQWLVMLEQLRAKQPGNLPVVRQLALAYRAARRLGDALQMIDQLRAAVANDADQLYRISELYLQIGQQPSAEKVLQQVVQLDPANSSACNDLGYFWADAGIHLPEAETLIRKALAVEPDNLAYLDSLGWAQYKQGDFIAAARTLKDAVDSPAPEAAVLDHYGDALYRQGDHAAAGQKWQAALTQVQNRDSDSNDDHALRLRLESKLRQLATGHTVNVAPAATRPATSPATQPAVR